jgi:hypothetical protein
MSRFVEHWEHLVSVVGAHIVTTATTTTMCSLFPGLVLFSHLTTEQKRKSFVAEKSEKERKRERVRERVRERERKRSSICQTNNQYPKFNSFSISLNPSEIQHFS